MHNSARYIFANGFMMPNVRYTEGDETRNLNEHVYRWIGFFCSKSKSSHNIFKATLSVELRELE